MKLLDINKCHVDSPDFKADLATLEVRLSDRIAKYPPGLQPQSSFLDFEWVCVVLSSCVCTLVNIAASPWRLILILSLLQDATSDLEKKVKRICDILKERQELAERERALTQRMLGREGTQEWGRGDHESIEGVDSWCSVIGHR